MEINQQFSKEEIYELSNKLELLFFGKYFSSMRIPMVFITILLCVLVGYFEFFLNVECWSDIRLKTYSDFVTFIWAASAGFLIARRLFYIICSKKLKKNKRIVITDNSITINENIYNLFDIDRAVYDDKFIIITIKKKYVCLNRKPELDYLILNVMKNNQ